MINNSVKKFVEKEDQPHFFHIFLFISLLIYGRIQKWGKKKNNKHVFFLYWAQNIWDTNSCPDGFLWAALEDYQQNCMYKSPSFTSWWIEANCKMLKDMSAWQRWEKNHELKSPQQTFRRARKLTFLLFMITGIKKKKNETGPQQNIPQQQFKSKMNQRRITKAFILAVSVRAGLRDSFTFDWRRRWCCCKTGSDALCLARIRHRTEYSSTRNTCKEETRRSSLQSYHFLAFAFIFLVRTQKIQVQHTPARSTDPGTLRSWWSLSAGSGDTQFGPECHAERESLPHVSLRNDTNT